MRLVYIILFYLSLPIILLRLLWRSIKVPGYRRRWLERFAIYRNNHAQDVVWFHAVSVGETEAVMPLLRLFCSRYPNLPILVTTMTPTGSARVKTLLKDSVSHVYLPYDVPGAWRRFIRHFRPKLTVIMETEIWPNLFAACSENRIPLYIVNARLTDKSVRGYRKIPSLIRSALANVRMIAAQTQIDADRFLAIGAPVDRIKTLGNIKFDVEIPESMADAGRTFKVQTFAGRFVWLIASTHQGEENIFAELYRRLKVKIPTLLLVLVPRHPERFIDVKKLCEERALQVKTRTSGAECHRDADVYLVDTMGELKFFYAACDLAFVGGSMVPVGGHNVLEAAAVGVPVMFGPYMDNFKEIASGLLAHNGALQCHNAEDICKAVLTLQGSMDQRNYLIRNSKNFLLANQGVVEIIFELLRGEL